MLWEKLSRQAECRLLVNSPVAPLVLGLRDPPDRGLEGGLGSPLANQPLPPPGMSSDPSVPRHPRGKTHRWADLFRLTVGTPSRSSCLSSIIFSNISRKYIDRGVFEKELLENWHLP